MSHLRRINLGRKATRRAFTLVELLVTIAIVGLLSGVAVVASGNSREKARIAAGQSFSAQINRVAGDASAGVWLLNEGTGTVAGDASGGGHAGELLNGAAWSADTPSGSGYSINLNGLNSYVQVPDYYGFKYVGNGLTLAAWVKPNASGNGIIISKPWNASGQYNYTLSYDGNINFGLVGSTSYYSGPTTTVPRGKWSFVVATTDAARNVNVYVDGALRFTDTHSIVSWTPSSGDQNTPLAVGTLFPYGGGWGGTVGFTFSGLIDEPRVFNGALSAGAIENLYAKEIKNHSNF